MIVRDITREDREEYLSMSKVFYSGGATLTPISEEHFQRTFQLAIQGSPFLRLNMLEEDGKIAGYCLLAFTYSNEAGGMVVWLEELYFKEEFRGRGLGSQYFAWIAKEYPDTARFRLEVCHSNTGAIKLYHRLGYQDLDYLQMIKDRS